MGLFSTPSTATLEEVSDRLGYADLADRFEQVSNDFELLKESLVEESYADVELALEDRGWRLLSARADRQFTRTGLRNAAKLCRTMAIVNPLIRRALSLRTAYIWSGGVEIAARANGKSEKNPNEQDVNAVIQGFLDDPATKKVLTGASAREANERQLGTDGVFALALFTLPRVGRVQPRPIDPDEIEEIIYNPEDSTEPWFYKRVWVREAVSLESGTKVSSQVTTYYPDINYRPRGVRPIRVNQVPVMWDAPVIFLKVNALTGWDFGIGDAFAAIPWARGYKEFLEDWARIMKGLSRYIWKVTAPSKKSAQTAKAGVVDANDDNPAKKTRVGGTGIMGSGTDLVAIPKSDATIDAEGGKPLAGMVAAAMDVPVTMLLTDPGITGARATAETLDTPTENMARMRRDIWGDFYRDLLGYVIDMAVKAPAGPLTGTVERDDWDREVITLAGDTERTIEISWPDLAETNVKDLVEAIAKADETGKLPPLTTLKLLLTALKVKDADEIVEAVTDDEGNWLDPDASAAQAAVERHRTGQDPADVVR